jgi:hypothetical protein
VFSPPINVLSEHYQTSFQAAVSPAAIDQHRRVEVGAFGK